MILLIDNYDSFTYNLVQRLGEIDSTLEIQVFRNDQITIEEIERLAPERILLSPGPCTPDDAGITLDVIRHFAGKVPLLGVCLAQPRCKSFLTWGFTDAHSWVPGFFTGMGAALPFNESYNPKPAYYGLRETLAQVSILPVAKKNNGFRLFPLGGEGHVLFPHPSRSTLWVNPAGRLMVR